MELKGKKDDLISKEYGFTLIELLIAMVIFGIVSAALFKSFQSQQASYAIEESVAAMQQNLRAGMDIMVRELRMAGYDPDPAGNAGAGITNIAIDGNLNSTVEFTMVADDDGLDNDNADGDSDTTTGADEPGELKTIKYDIYDAFGDGINDLGRQVGSFASTKRAVAENIEALELFYTLADGSSALTPANPDNVRSVRISILARTEHSDPKFMNILTYTTPGGQNWGPYNDNFRRRLLTTAIKCRNMGL